VTETQDTNKMIKELDNKKGNQDKKKIHMTMTRDIYARQKRKKS